MQSRTLSAAQLRSCTVALALAGSLGVLTACGDSGANKTGALRASPGSSLPGMPGDAPSSIAGMDMPSAPAVHDAKPVAGNSVAIKNFAFTPAALTVPAGTTVTWTNRDTDAHTVTSQGSGGPLHSPAMDSGATFSFTFTKAGTYQYLCTIHPFMTATVTVTP
jgi:plastocyanin